MINRILIRIKVIQILYSFLLVEKQFTLERNPSAPTKEKRFAYSLYLDMLVLFIKVSRAVGKRKGESPLEESRFISRLLLDDKIKSLLQQYNEEFPLEGAVAPVAEVVVGSASYKNYLKELSKGSVSEENLWPRIFTHIVMTNPTVKALIASRENYTPKGVERMKEMVRTTFTNFLASQDNVNEVVDALEKSLELARELYFRLLLLPVELTELQDRILDDNRHKHLLTEEDINPNLRFVENQLVEQIRKNPVFEKYVEKNKLSWMQEDPVMMRNLLKTIKDSDIYWDYMEAPMTDMYHDCELWRNLMKYIILENSEFLEFLEDKSVFWNDDVEILSTFVMKTFRRIEEGNDAQAVLSKYKDDEDARFGAELITALYKNKEIYRRYIDDALEGGGWDADRLAFMDIVILEAALAEILNFPKVPLSVSVNEYIELAKSYSTNKSGAFVHGILGSVIGRLQQEGVLLKR